MLPTGLTLNHYPSIFWELIDDRRFLASSHPTQLRKLSPAGPSLSCSSCVLHSSPSCPLWWLSLISSAYHTGSPGPPHSLITDLVSLLLNLLCLHEAHRPVPNVDSALCISLKSAPPFPPHLSLQRARCDCLVWAGHLHPPATPRHHPVVKGSNISSAPHKHLEPSDPTQ